ncbi:MAG: ribosome silencing factor [Desulfovibrio sp.]|nr:ribosome silencing factor [Desulfovibrio sp.]
MQKTSFLFHKVEADARHFADVPLQEKLAHVTDWLKEHKAIDVVSIDLTGQGAFVDGLVIAGAGSVRHAQSLADGLGLFCRERNYEYLRTEGYAAGQWILADMNEIVVNIFQESVRALYGLEGLWGRRFVGSAHGGE